MTSLKRDRAVATFRDGSRSLKLYDFVVANVSFSTKSWSNGFNPAEDEFRRFAYGIPAVKNGDHVFLLHILASLKSTGWRKTPR